MSSEKNLLIANKYAEALIDFPKEGKVSYTKISEDLSLIKKTLERSKDLFDVLVNPIISVNDKLEILNSIFSDNIDDIVKNFLKILVEKNRFSIIFDVIVIYSQLLDEVNNISRVEVFSAIELNDVEKNKIVEKLKMKLKKNVQVNWSINKELMAGFIVKIGDDVIDFSLGSKLDSLKKAITK